jgi:hypothetical protein
VSGLDRTVDGAQQRDANRVRSTATRSRIANAVTIASAS